MANKILHRHLFLFELAFLVIFPWSQYWENNLFLAYLPASRPRSQQLLPRCHYRF
jgi:hypothetical protein